MKFRSVSIATIIAAVFLALAAPAAQASAVCDRLNAKLTELPKSNVISNANLRDYAAAISRQNLDLRQVRSERRRAGCNAGSVIAVGAAADDSCQGLNSIITQMEANLQDLKARRQQLVSGGDDTQRRRILAALDVNRCAEEQDEILQAAASEPETHRNILKDLPPIRESILSDQGEIPNFALPGDDYGGSLRTMCVRTCDGAFFPISSNATPADFQRDAETCHRRCPGAETALYYHALTTEESEQMISASTGEPYIDLPTAFVYKTRDPATAGQCGCAPAKTANQSTPQQGSIVTVTSGNTQVKPDIAATITIPDRPYDPQDKKVRLVGPSFLPTEETSIDLHHPTGPTYQPQQPN